MKFGVFHLLGRTKNVLCFGCYGINGGGSGFAAVFCYFFLCTQSKLAVLHTPQSYAGKEEGRAYGIEVRLDLFVLSLLLWKIRIYDYHRFSRFEKHPFLLLILSTKPTNLPTTPPLQIFAGVEMRGDGWDGIGVGVRKIRIWTSFCL